MTARRKLSEARRAQILKSAVRVIGERGLSDTRISDIAKLAGTSSALVLYYFGSKDQLLTEALMYAEDRFYEEAAAALAPIESAKDRMVKLVDLSCLTEASGDDGWFYEMLWIELWARAPRDETVARNRESMDRRWRETIAGVVREGQASGEFGPVDADDFALRFAALTDGLAIQVALDDPSCDAKRMREVCLRTASVELGFDASSVSGAAARGKRPARGAVARG